jgi:hypothetical protein
MKQSSFFGRIQERLVTRDRESQTAAPRSRNPEVRSEAAWLVETIRRTAGRFSALAEQDGIAPVEGAGPGDDGLGEDDDELARTRALLLAYKLTVTACRRRDPAPGRELLAELRSEFSAELGKSTTGSESGRGLSSGHAARALDVADTDTAASLIRFEAGLPDPLAPFYGDLAPTFGGPCAGDQLEERYGKIVRHLYEALQKKLDTRDRGAAASRTPKAGVAGAGH